MKTKPRGDGFSGTPSDNPVIPLLQEQTVGGLRWTPILTKREYYAALALQGLLPLAYAKYKRGRKNLKWTGYMAHLSRLLADAMIAELEPR